MKNHKIIIFACCVVFLISAVALALDVRTSSQGLQDHKRKEKNKLLKQIENSPDQPLRIVEGKECPLRLVEAKVKEIPDSLFTQLTGKTTNLITVSSVPEATLVNTSEKTVTGFALAIRDPKSRVTRGIMRTGVSITAGASFIIKRSLFVKSKRVTLVDGNGRISHPTIAPELAENYWLDFAGLDDLYATIGLVNFADGSKWIIKDGGEVK